MIGKFSAIGRLFSAIRFQMARAITVVWQATVGFRFVQSPQPPA